MDIEQIDKSEREYEDVDAVQQRRPNDRSNQKHKQESDNERKPLNRRTANLLPSASRQSTPRDKKPGSDETKQSAGGKKLLICYRCGGKGHLARLCPSADDCQDVDEIGTEPSSDADSDLFGLDWGDDPIAEWRTRNTHVLTDASDRADVDMDELADPDGLGGEVTDTVGTARVLAAPPHVPYRPWCRFCVMGRETSPDTER